MSGLLQATASSVWWTITSQACIHCWLIVFLLILLMFSLRIHQLGLANKPIFLPDFVLVKTFRTYVYLLLATAVASLIFATLLCETCLATGHGRCIVSFPLLGGVIPALPLLMVSSLVLCPVIKFMIAQYICDVLGLLLVLHWKIIQNLHWSLATFLNYWLLLHSSLFAYLLGYSFSLV